MIDLFQELTEITVLDILKYMDVSDDAYILDVKEHHVIFGRPGSGHKYHIPISAFHLTYAEFKDGKSSQYGGIGLMEEMIQLGKVNLRLLLVNKLNTLPLRLQRGRYWCSFNVMVSYEEVETVRSGVGMRIRSPLKSMDVLLDKPKYAISSKIFADMCDIVKLVAEDRRELIKVWSEFTSKPSLQLFDIYPYEALNGDIADMLDCTYPNVKYVFNGEDRRGTLRLGNQITHLSRNAITDEIDYRLEIAVEFSSLYANSPYIHLAPERNICKYVYFCNALKHGVQNEIY